MQTGNAWGRNLDNCSSTALARNMWRPALQPTHEIEDPIRRRAQRRALCTHGQRVDLRRIQPRHTLPADAEEYVVQEEEGDGAFRPLATCVKADGEVLVIPDTDGDNGVAEELTRRGVHHHLASAPALDVGNTNEGE